MTITQTIEVSDSRRITLDIPPEIPRGRTILTFTPASAASMPGNSPRTVEEALRMADERLADPNRKSISRFFGILSPDTYGDGVIYQRKLRDEWDG